jgi:hypothetical protein
MVPSWQLNSTQYPALKWPDKQIFTGKIENWVPSQTKKVPSEKKKGTKLAGEDLIENQQIMRDGIKKVSSLHEKGTKLLSRKSLYLISLLTLTLKPVKREELMEILHYENRKTFNDLYLKPLLQVGLSEEPMRKNQGLQPSNTILPKKANTF